MGKINTAQLFIIELKKDGQWQQLIEFFVEDVLKACRILDAYKALYKDQTVRLITTAAYGTFFNKLKNIFEKNKDDRSGDNDPIYKHLITEARSKYPKDPFKQLSVVREQDNPMYEFLAMVDVAQDYLLHEHYTIEIDSDEVEFLYRSLEDLARYLKPVDPGVYRYNLGNIRTLTEEILHRVEDKKVKAAINN